MGGGIMLNKGLFASVKVIGVGEYGVDTINGLSELGLKGVEFIAYIQIDCRYTVHMQMSVRGL